MRTRWSDNDYNLGPLTFAWAEKSYRPFAIILKSWGSGDDDDGPASIRISLVWFTLILLLPPLLYPLRRKVYPEGWDAETIARLGRDWYWDVKVREYGFSYSDGFLIVNYGIHPGDSRLDQTWSYFLPWTQWRRVRHSLYDLSGGHNWSQLEGAKTGFNSFEAFQAAKDLCPKAQFSFEDHDGERLVATTVIEEREWKFGTGWFKWLSCFRRPKIRRSLDIEFSGETGPEKGSWKGGTTGTSIDMRPGELHEAAFRRYCDERHRSKYGDYNVKFIGAHQ